MNLSHRFGSAAGRICAYAWFALRRGPGFLWSFPRLWRARWQRFRAAAALGEEVMHAQKHFLLHQHDADWPHTN